ncbi:acyl-protein thioesterase 1 [Nadsonia fulvescens var. elongata DSM 6958]|uniref:Acyl-protein thioesterase 1 n=1 Tax=Nadsonia fulvescens var. elongata DSM 6958 TaxID=857566 RepID=A0A1E3PR44_9ASCO|nr:acyl-protein thioesterase 1 [Nadsonia fulvescens var. elongata DSM 6958]
MVFPAAVRIPATTAPSATFIFLHGLGDSGNGWRFLAEEARRQNRLSHVKFVFPDAPNIPVSLNYGMVMPAWYNIRQLAQVQENQDEDGILQSVGRLEKIIEEEKDSGVASDRIIIGGFSQGAAISLATSVLLKEKIGGVVALSGYMPIHEKILNIFTKNNLHTPYFCGHGTADNVIQFKWGRNTKDFLIQELGIKNVEWHTYSGLVHSVAPEEIEDLFTFLEKNIPA